MSSSDPFDGETDEAMLGKLEIVADLPQAQLAALEEWRKAPAVLDPAPLALTQALACYRRA